MSNILKELRENLEVLPISELRQKAVRNFGLRLTREETKEDIINKIVVAASKQEFAVEAAGDMPAPGWTRIRVHPVPGKPTFPFFVGINGYFCSVPFNIDVDVPSKIIGVLKDAIEHRYSLDYETGFNKITLEQSYPFNIIATTPGPDPRPGNEVARERRLQVKRDFAEREGFWPSDDDIKEIRKNTSQADALKAAMHPVD